MSSSQQAEVKPRTMASERTLLIVTPYFQPAVGGLEQYVSGLVNHLGHRKNWRVVVLTSGEQHGQDACELANGFTLYRLGYDVKLSNTPLALTWIRRIRSIIHRENPDLINAHLPVPGLADATAWVVREIPLIVTYHTTSMHKGNVRYDIPIWLYERTIRNILLRKATRIICSSAAVEDHLGSYACKCIVIPPAVDINVFTPVRRPSGRRLLFVGSLTKSHTHKGLSYLLEAFAGLSCEDVFLDIVGDGNARGQYEARCRQLGITQRVVFHGQLEGDLLATRYRASYALVHPSTNDSLPTTIVEAMASGLPVIASRVGAVPSIVHDGVNGRLTKPGDVRSLVNAITELISDPDKAAEYGRFGRSVVESMFTVEDQVDRTEAVFDEVYNLVSEFSNRNNS
jgi:glycosyltransferase involved in cell wall biosynthesis